VAVIVAFSVPLVHILLSAKFLPAVPLLWILAPGVVIYGASQILMAYFRGIKRPGICSFVIWVGLIANALALAILYPRIGLSAAAWATTIGFACRSVVLFGAYKHVSGAQVLDVMRFRRDDFGRVRILLAELFAKLFCVRNEKA
jgi:O-antigen/teichoic acid export membrane protein